MELNSKQKVMYLSWIGRRRVAWWSVANRTKASLSSVRPAAYVLALLAAIGVAWSSTLWDGIFACQASGYAANAFVAECSAPNYGDYEHGAFWFDLEPAAVDAASNAQALFLGDSRVQVAFNSKATTNWFNKADTSYYLLGFGWAENVTFTGALLDKLKPQAKVLIVNIDDFFDEKETAPANRVMHQTGAKISYEIKRFWQYPHEMICSRFPRFCDTSYVVFRSRETGGYEINGDHDAHGHWYRSAPVSYFRGVDAEKTARYIESGRDFLSQAPVRKDCVIATIIPYPGTRIGTAKAVADGLGLTFVAPELDGLQTFDASHLDRTSAERWTAEFYKAAGPQIRRCIISR